VNGALATITQGLRPSETPPGEGDRDINELAIQSILVDASRRDRAMTILTGNAQCSLKALRPENGRRCGVPF